ncbi:1,4-dihydroxy-2-naphthoate polyprenyltransferase [Enterococcus phoeniculicola]|jgi:1,4-dihydroxy-2-naphthoate octaprenyltransferase|uniref:UbiA family prenyltransferase n=1 Tax=Enterococcus phoeniculicola ATCC BAA-412 TaxID=1158610 RepID=R3TUU0_9ENTE|nr:1,4-dihydroxy-2-naphthoate polyprenyltransferase [Enterococcus phoeniculicola]EOL45374.1 UbiA family prenyltransferase [Enterococcus phoeniculicola ATCC BAA-412]EOT74736.1 UbiA family prenyltransferase [Enterococcus phoeniculicola ATCC BAA-412]
MSFKVFLEVVEIRTKVASVFPFVIGLLFSLTYFKQVHWSYTALFFVGMVIFDLATTAINNYMDYQKAHSDVYKYEENVIGREQLSPTLVRNMIFAMIFFVLCVGLVLTYFTGWLLLIMGGVCCFIGIFYTFGPVPLSRMPLGEIFSGVTMGLGIFAMTVYLNTFSKHVFYLDVDFRTGAFSLDGSLWAVLAVVAASLPLIFTIANIMLANNLRDLDRDIENRRYTLVYYIGRPQGILLFQGLMYGCYLIIGLGLLFGLYEWPILVTFLSLPKIYSNLKEYKDVLPQPKSFGYAIKNMILFNGSYVLGLVLTFIWQKI